MFDLLNFERTGYIDEPVFLSLAGLGRMPEYSHTLPTGLTVWKFWRRLRERVVVSRPANGPPFIHESWDMGMYVPIPHERDVGIRWQPIYVIEGVLVGALLDALFTAFGLSDAP